MLPSQFLAYDFAKRLTSFSMGSFSVIANENLDYSDIEYEVPTRIRRTIALHTESFEWREFSTVYCPDPNESVYLTRLLLPEEAFSQLNNHSLLDVGGVSILSLLKGQCPRLNIVEKIDVDCASLLGYLFNDATERVNTFRTTSLNRRNNFGR